MLYESEAFQITPAGSLKELFLRREAWRHVQQWVAEAQEQHGTLEAGRPGGHHGVQGLGLHVQGLQLQDTIALAQEVVHLAVL